MSRVLISEESLTNIANAIRAKNGESTTYKPSEMATAINAIEAGGGIETCTVTISPGFKMYCNFYSATCYENDAFVVAEGGDLSGSSITSTITINNVVVGSTLTVGGSTFGNYFTLSGTGFTKIKQAYSAVIVQITGDASISIIS